MASEEQCLTDQFSKPPFPPITYEDPQTEPSKSSELPERTANNQSDSVSEKGTISSHCFIEELTTDDVAGVTNPNCTDDATQDEFIVSPNEATLEHTGLSSEPCCGTEDISDVEFHTKASEGTLRTPLQCKVNNLNAPWSSVATAQHDSDCLETVSSLPFMDTPTGEAVPTQVEGHEEHTVISIIPLAREELNAKNIDVISDSNNFISNFQQNLAPNPEENLVLSPICCDLTSLDEEIGTWLETSIGREKTGDCESLASADQIFQNLTGAFQQIFTKDEEISKDKNNENFVENLTVIDKGNNNSNNNNNNNNSILENPVQVFDKYKHPLGLVIDVSANSKIPPVGQVRTGDNYSSRQPNDEESLSSPCENSFIKEEPQGEEILLQVITDEPQTVCGQVTGQDDNEACSAPPPAELFELCEGLDDPASEDSDVFVLPGEEVSRIPDGGAETLVGLEDYAGIGAEDILGQTTSSSQNITTYFVLSSETETSNFISGNAVTLGNVADETEAPGSPLRGHSAGKCPQTPVQSKSNHGDEARLAASHIERREFEASQQRSVSLPALLKTDKKMEVEVRKTSLFCHGTLPTISEKTVVEELQQQQLPKKLDPEEDFEIGFDFSLENSPMLRNSRRKNTDRKRKDCRHLFNDPPGHLEDGSGTSEEDEERPRCDYENFRSLRDSLDIAKHNQLSIDASFKDDEGDEVENLLNRNEAFPKEGSPTTGETSFGKNSKENPSPRKLPQYTGKSMSLKKKTSLKNEKGGTRRVSFPEDDSRLITSYLEPVNPWHHMGEVSTDVISEAYRKSCDRHKTRALPLLLQQIAALPVEVGGRIECLSFRSHRLDSCQCECLEEIFRRVQFQTLDFEACELDDDSAIPLFDMIEFYDSAIQLNISSNAKIGNRGWQACARMMKRAPSLRMLEARATNLSEQTMPILCKALRLGTRLHTLHLENCNLTGRPLVNLVGALRLNDTITDLYLADNRLGTNDCIQLGNLVRANRTLRLFDLRNNNIQDAGCNHICKDIAEQQNIERNKMEQEKSSVSGDAVAAAATPAVAAGLTTLVLWNNHITVHAVPHFSLMLTANFTLETLNLGRNNLTSEGVLLLKNALIRNRSLRRLGLQATRIGNEGAVALAECLADSALLARIDLRENSIQVAGLLALCRSLKINRSVVQLDLDANPRAEPSSELSEQHVALHQEIKALCQRNQTDVHLRESRQKQESEGTGRVEIVSPRPLPLPDKRKISLTCETVYRPAEDERPPQEPPGWAFGEGKRYRSPAPSPSVSPCPSPSLSPSLSPVPSPLKTRFRVSRVSEEGGGSPSPTLSLSPVMNARSSFSVSAPAFFMTSTMGGSLPSLAPSTRLGLAPAGARRFTVTKVAEPSSFKRALPHTIRTMSSPSLIAPLDANGVTAAPTIVVSSPNKAVRGFSVEGSDPFFAPHAKIVEGAERIASFELPPGGSRSNSFPSSGSDNPQQEHDDVFVSPSPAKPRSPPTSEGVAPQRAPLASTEAGSFDSDSEDSELATQSTDSTRSDEVRVCTEGASFVAAWDGHKGPAPPNATGSGPVIFSSSRGTNNNTSY